MHWYYTTFMGGGITTVLLHIAITAPFLTNRHGYERGNCKLSFIKNKLKPMTA